MTAEIPDFRVQWRGQGRRRRSALARSIQQEADFNRACWMKYTNRFWRRKKAFAAGVFDFGNDGYNPPAEPHRRARDAYKAAFTFMAYINGPLTRDVL